jgi:hypothetical protein
LYDEDAIDGSDAKEDGLGFDPLKGEWAVSLPCRPKTSDERHRIRVPQRHATESRYT